MPIPNVVGVFAPSLREERLHLSTFVQFPSPDVVEVLARTPLQSFVLDMQHGMFDEAAVIGSIAAAALEAKPILIRVPVDAAGLTSRVLDFGAAGIICPMVNTREDAEKLVSYARFAPLGARSWGPRRALPISGLSAADYLKRANDLIVVFAMIETRQALDNLEDILSTPGIDGVFVGPMDLSVSLSEGCTLASPEVDEAVARVARHAGDHGKLAGIFATTPKLAGQYARAGYRFVALQQDAMFMTSAAANAFAGARVEAGESA